MGKQWTNDETNTELQDERYYKKTGRKRKYLFLKLVIIAVLVAAGAIPLALSSVFNISLIEVRGNQHYNSDEISNAAGIPIGANGFKSLGGSVVDMLTLHYGVSEQKLKKVFPYIKNVSVRYIPPSRVRITLDERSPAAMVECDGTTLLTDGEGCILDIINRDTRPKLPVIKGLKLEHYVLGTSLKVDNPDSLKAANTVMSAIKKSDEENSFKLYDQLVYIDAGDTNNVRIFVDSRIQVNFGDMQELDYRIGFFRYVYQNMLKKEDKGLFDFTKGPDPNFIPDQQ